MKISTDYLNIRQPSFGSLRISLNAREAMTGAKGSYVRNLFTAGKKLDDTQYFDLQVLKDLSLRIKEKGNVFSGIKAPIKFIMSGDRKIKVTGVYDGLDDETRKRGQNIDFYLNFDTPEYAKNIYDLFEQMNSIGKFSMLTKLLDEEMICKFSGTKYKENNVEKLIDILFDKYSELGL